MSLNEQQSWENIKHPLPYTNGTKLLNTRQYNHDFLLVNYMTRRYDWEAHLGAVHKVYH